MALTCKYGTDLDTDLGFKNRCPFRVNCTLKNKLHTSGCNHMILLNKNVSVLIKYIVCRISSEYTVMQCLNYFLAVRKCLDIHSRNLGTLFGTILLTNDKFLGNIYKTSCKISRVSCSKSGIRQTLTCSVSRHEVLQNVKTLTEVRFDRQLDSLTCCISHQTTHTGKLFDLLVRTTGT